MIASRSDTSFLPMLEATIALRSPRRILEWGPGRSTLRLTELLPGAEIISIEHSQEWYKHWIAKLPKRVNLQRVDFDNFYTKPLNVTGKFDLIFVDGRRRRRCLLSAIDLLAPNGVVILHDAQRDWYHSALAEYKYQAWDGYDTVALSQSDLFDIQDRVNNPINAKIPHIVMVTHGSRERFLKRTIPAVLKTNGAFTFTVVANGPGKRAAKYLRDNRADLYGLIINPKNLGKPIAANAGWRLRDADCTVLLDDDALPLDPTWLDELIAIVKDCPQVGVCGHSFEPRTWERKTLMGHPVQIQPGNIGGACILVPRRTLKACGRYNEELPPYGESDGLYGWKVRQAGLLCVYHDFEVTGRRFEHIDDGKDAKYRQWKNKTRAKAQIIERSLRKEYLAGRPLNS